MIVSRRELVAGAALLSSCVPRSTVNGCGDLAGKGVRWIVPYPPGGSYDVFSRLLETPLEQALGAEVVIANESAGLVGATRLRDAAPDGRTLGILNAPGLLAASLAGQAGVPNPALDFTLLGRISRARTVIVSHRSSSLRTVDDLIARSSVKPLLFGISGATSNNLLSIAGTMSLLGLPARFLAGYGGSREELLGLMRGEFDLFSSNLESVQTGLESGELNLLVQIAAEPFFAHPPYSSAGVLGGPGGWAARRAGANGRTPAQAVDDAATLSDALMAGIVAVAPPRLSPELRDCLRAKFQLAAQSPSFVAGARAARRTLDIGTGAETQVALEAAATKMARFAPIVREAIARIRR